jgi:hypothetical protein
VQWIENRIVEIERRLEYWIRQIQDLIPQLRAAAQTARNAFQQYQIPSSGGGGNPLYCVTTGSIAASGAIPAGSPTHITGQSVYSISAGAFTLVSAAADLYNGMPNAVGSGAKCIVIANADGTYSVIQVAC